MLLAQWSSPLCTECSEGERQYREGSKRELVPERDRNSVVKENTRPSRNAPSPNIGLLRRDSKCEGAMFAVVGPCFCIYDFGHPYSKHGISKNKICICVIRVNNVFHSAKNWRTDFSKKIRIFLHRAISPLEIHCGTHRPLTGPRTGYRNCAHTQLPRSPYTDP